MSTVETLIGSEMEEEFFSFDLTEIQQVLSNLKTTNAIDLAHADLLQQQTLRAADILAEYLSRVIKTVSYLESKVNSLKNRLALEYQAPDGSRTTMEMRKWRGESAPEVEEWNIKLAKAKGTKSLLEKKYDIIIRSHHFYKDLSMGLKRGITSNTSTKASMEW